MDDLVEHGTFVVPCYNWIQDKKAELAQASKVVPDADRFINTTTFDALETEFVVGWVVSVSDMTTQEVLGTMDANDSTGVNILLQWGIQIQMGTKIPFCLLTKEVMRRFLDDRHCQCGKRLHGVQGRRRPHGRQAVL